jgi:pimeloyl-ACP methyl ester carboxylesterase
MSLRTAEAARYKLAFFPARDTGHSIAKTIEGSATMDDGLQGLTPVEPRKPFGIMPNSQHQTFHGFMKGAPYELAIVEFDDQGRCYDRGQMDGVAERLTALAPDDVPTGEDVILVVFVHGWQHDARSDDDNLNHFRMLLKQTVEYERLHASPGVAPRPVLGVFAGWRGLSDFGLGDVVADATFWGRQAAGQRVAVGSVRELFGRLRHYRNRQQKRGGNPLLVIVGHSFGGMIVFSALAQSLIQAASAPVGHVTPEFANLVLLVNPAIEAARYIPIYDLVTSAAFQARTTKQLPVFICAQADNDQPVGLVFPLGNAGHAITEATIGELEKWCVRHALGFVPHFRTHKLAGPAADNPFVLDPPGTTQANPFWVVGATKEVINGHGGIWQAPFLQFIASLVFQHVQASKRGPEGAAGSAAPGEPRPAGDLASFAKSIGPIELPKP